MMRKHKRSFQKKKPAVFSTTPKTITDHPSPQARMFQTSYSKKFSDRLQTLCEKIYKYHDMQKPLTKSMSLP